MIASSARALVVEDDRVWQQILDEILTDLGLGVDVANDLEDAMTIMRARPHRLAVADLALDATDHHNREGLGILDAVRQYDTGCVTILLTGYATVELAVDVLTEHGAFTCLRKETFNRSQFRDIVHRALTSAPPTSAITQSTSADADAPVAMVVEDDAGWRRILSELLIDAGYQVRLCTGFAEAFGLLRREKYALAIIDLWLPRSNLLTPDKLTSAQEMDGYRLLTSARAGRIPTIVVSGVGTPADMERTYAEQGIFAYIEKQTFDRGAFLRTVEEARRAQPYGSELDALTDREREVLELLAKGMTNKEIAETLVITPNTVKRHLKAIFEKLEIHTRSAAAAKAISAGVPGDRASSDGTITN